MDGKVAGKQVERRRSAASTLASGCVEAAASVHWADSAHRHIATALTQARPVSPPGHHRTSSLASHGERFPVLACNDLPCTCAKSMPASHRRKAY